MLLHNGSDRHRGSREACPEGRDTIHAAVDGGASAKKRLASGLLDNPKTAKELYGRHDAQAGSVRHLRREMAHVRCHENIRLALQGRQEDRNVGSMANEVAMGCDFFEGRSGHALGVQSADKPVVR